MMEGVRLEKADDGGRGWRNGIEREIMGLEAEG